ncbi:GNAT family N-acetyltransferase [Maritalea myrionectae]|uniref:GNAT family N-acetyltransferase n=1 Tax=Maritalea myrionectae TaxID=454601 RepID=UPI00068891AE|nr:GNAT family N-acetyltransferase [Maritalea myrionectae]
MLKLNIEGWRLRPMEKADAADFQRILEQYDVAKFLMPIKHPFPEGAAEVWVREKLKNGALQNTSFAILNPAGDVSDNVGFDQDGDNCHLGYYLDMPYWGKGVMSGAVATVLAWLFDASETTLVHSGAFEINPASLAIQKKLGFIETGRGTAYCAAQEQELGHIDTALSRDRFLKNRVGSNA